MIVFHGFVETDVLNTEGCIKHGDRVYTVLSFGYATEWDRRDSYVDMCHCYGFVYLALERGVVRILSVS